MQTYIHTHSETDGRTDIHVILSLSKHSNIGHLLHYVSFFSYHFVLSNVAVVVAIDADAANGQDALAIFGFILHGSTDLSVNARARSPRDELFSSSLFKGIN